MSDDPPIISSTSSVQMHDLPDEVKNLAENLGRKHGEIHIALEEGGMHLYMACPHHIQLDGRKELDSRHLAVNADKYLCRGEKWGRLRGTYPADLSASCMKDSKVYAVSTLLKMPTLEERGIPDVRHGVKISSTVRYLEPDGKGNMIPEGPGELTDIETLDPSHPARWYLENRGYDIATLKDQARVAFCHAELPQDDTPSVKRFYKSLPLGLKNTPQGRIIFFCDVEGVQLGWQGRIIDYVDADKRFILHPYTWQWTHVETYSAAAGKFLPIDEIAMSDRPWDLAKYKWGRSTQRNQLLLGLDAAVRWNRNMGIKRPIGFLVEGPLDAGRWGPPGIGQLGKHLSETQADLLGKYFDRILYFPDNDAAGKASLKKVANLLSTRVDFDVMELEAFHPGKKDVGSLTANEAWDLVKNIAFR